MSSGDLKNMYLVATGAALCAAGVVSANNSSWLDAITDISHVLTIIAPFLGASGIIVAAIGLAPLIVKYGKKLYEKLNGKESQYSTEKENPSQDNFHKRHLLKRFLMHRVEPETPSTVSHRKNLQDIKKTSSSEREM